MLIKTLLNKVERFKSFVYDTVHIAIIAGNEVLIIDIRLRSNSNPRCHKCGKRCGTYDRQPKRLFEHVPIWTFKVYFRYAPRRVSCPDHGIKVEAMPWAYGKERMTRSYKVYLARGQRGCRGRKPPPFSRLVGIRYFALLNSSSITAYPIEPWMILPRSISYAW